jgi:quercetin dioxygenase-like cupin family protein
MCPEDDELAEQTLCDLCSALDIKPTGYLRKGDRILALPTAFGTRRRIHGCTKKLMMISYTWDQGAKMLSHDHEVEQISYVVDGKLKITIGDESFIAEKGDSYTEPKRITHSVEALEPSVTIECFTPPRPLFTILEAAASHDLHGAFEGVKKAMDAAREQH